MSSFVIFVFDHLTPGVQLCLTMSELLVETRRQMVNMYFSSRVSFTSFTFGPVKLNDWIWIFIGYTLLEKNQEIIVEGNRLL